MALWRTKPCKRHGAAVLEMALIGSILCSLVLIAVDLGRMQVISQTADSAIYEAARLGLSPRATDEDVRGVVMETMDLIRVKELKIEIDPSPLDATATEVSVRIQIPLRQNVLFFPTDRILQRSCTLRRRIDW